MAVISLPLNVLKNQWKAFANIHPLLKGSITYAILWPTGSMIQQTLEGKNFKTYDYMQMLRFGIYGSMYVAPTLYGWVRLSTAMWPQTNLRTGIVKAATEQISYGPFAASSFFMGMTLLETQSFEKGVKEVKEKFLPTFKTGIMIWPILQTINFSMIPERNRVVFVSICSLMWTTFLAYVKNKKINENASQVQVE